MARTPVDLYRVGNKTSARLDRVRSIDVVHFQRNGIPWVKGRSGGISTWDSKDATLSGVWWRLPAGITYDDDVLFLHNDMTGHWSWEPAFDMALSAYQSALASVNLDFIRA